MFHAGGRFIADPYEWFLPCTQAVTGKFKTGEKTGESMNFYRMFPGDYIADTSTLSLAEHGAYMLMLHYFYHTEVPLPSGIKLYRLLRAETKAEREAVDAVCDRYWIPISDGLINRKATDELHRASEMAERNKQNGKKGGRPKGDIAHFQKPRKNPVGF
jgi:uncharacterized protein YdaU (DUF1376 family)